MRFATSVLAAAALALVCGGVFAADDSTREKENQAHRGFNELDKNADGKLTREEVAGNKDLLKRWKSTDKNNDGFVTRAEYLQEMAKKDWNTAKEKVGASTGSTADSKPK